MGEPAGTAVVTGAAGFVGRALCGALTDDGWQVRALLRRPTAGPWSTCAVAELGTQPVPAALLAGADVVFHLAGKAHSVEEVGEGDAAYTRSNVAGTAAVLAAAEHAGVPRVVYLSSVKAAGSAAHGATDESVTAPPDTPYGRSKAEAERLVLAAGPGGQHVCVLRPALVYGPGVKGNLLRMLAAVDRGRFPPVPEFGNRRSMVHVRDLVDAARLVAATPAAGGRTYVVTDGRPCSTREIYLAMAAALGRRVPGWSLPRPALRALAPVGDLGGRVRGRRLPFDTTAYQRLAESAWYSSARLERETGFRAGRDLPSALPEVVAAYRAAAAS